MLRRASSTTISSALAVVALALVTSCSSGSPQGSNRTGGTALRDTGNYHSEFALPGKRVSAELRETSPERLTTIVNRGSTDPVEVYSKPQPPGVTVKVALDDYMADFCENLRRNGFYDYARSSVTPGARWSLALDVDGARRVLSYDDSLSVEARQRMIDLKLLFFALFNQTPAMQVVANPGGADLFEQEKMKLQQVKPGVKTRDSRP